MIGIYKITSPSGRIYIGQTRDFKNRLKDYKYLKGSVKQRRLHNSFLKYGVINHCFEFIEECLFEELNIFERKWQDYYNVTSKKGLNCVLQETDDLPKIISEESRKKMSESQKGKHFSDDTRLKIGEFHKGNKYRHGCTVSEETRLKQSEAHKCKKHSEETKLKMSLAITGFKHFRSIKIINVITLEIFDTITEASKKLKIPISTFRAHLNGLTKINKTNCIYYDKHS